MSECIAGGARPLQRVKARAAVYVVLLALAAAYFLAWPVWRAQFLVEIWFTESWNAYLQDAAANGLDIYPAPESLIGNNYPPLSFYAVAVLGKLLGADNLFIGRALSLIALGAIAVEVFVLVRLLSGSKTGAAVAALWYLAIMSRNSTVYIGTNDPQLAGLAMMGAALIQFIRSWRRQASPMPALLLMVMAGFWKHNNVAIPLAALSWLYINRSSHALRATLVSASAVLVGLGACRVLFGPNFIPDLLATRQYAWSNVLVNIGHLQWSALALLLWAAWAVFDRKSEAAQFTALHIGLSLITCILQWLGHGVSGNAEFDLILALAIGLGVAFNRVEASPLAERIGADHCRSAMVAALLLRLIVADRQETALLLLSPEFRQSLYISERNVLHEAKAVAMMPGQTACFVKLVCRLAGKPFTVDEFKMDELVATGKATPADISAMLEANSIRWIPKTLPTGAEADTSFSRWWRSFK
jgi:hypothetical protein